MKIAVVTPTPSLFEFVQQCFPSDCALSRFDDEQAMTRAMTREDFDVILLDAYQGFDEYHALFSRRQCQSEWRTPLIAIGTAPACDGIEKAFEAGVDEVVTAPLNAAELVVRTRLTRQRFDTGQYQVSTDELCFGIYRLDRSTACVHIGNESIGSDKAVVARLTAREFAIAWLLFSRQGQYVTRRHLAATIWGTSEEIVGRSLEQHIYKLRKKLRLNGECGTRLTTRYAHGYRIEASHTSAMPVPRPIVKTSRLPAALPRAVAPIDGTRVAARQTGITPSCYAELTGAVHAPPNSVLRVGETLYGASSWEGLPSRALGAMQMPPMMHPVNAPLEEAAAANAAATRAARWDTPRPARAVHTAGALAARSPHAWTGRSADGDDSADGMLPFLIGPGAARRT